MSVKYIYLAPVSDDMASQMEGFFLFNGVLWEYRLEVDLLEGFLRLEDSCGRMVPIDSGAYKDFGTVFQILAGAQEDTDKIKKNSKDELDEALDDLMDFGISNSMITA